MDINVFAKFNEIPSMPVQDIKEKPKRHGWMSGKKDWHENSITQLRGCRNCYCYSHKSTRGVGGGKILAWLETYHPCYRWAPPEAVCYHFPSSQNHCKLLHLTHFHQNRRRVLYGPASGRLQEYLSLCILHDHWMWKFYCPLYEHEDLRNLHLKGNYGWILISYGWILVSYGWILISYGWILNTRKLWMNTHKLWMNYS